MLTKKQKQILDFINQYIKENKYSPTLREIMQNFNLKSVSGVHQHITSLKNKGYLKKEPGISRSLEPKKKTKTPTFEIPVVGTITAGQPIEAVELIENWISITNPLVKNSKDYYALKVEGDSMIEDGIFDGDTVVIKKQSTAENGQTVVAIIDDNSATLKKIYREKNKFRLQPANQAILPFYRKEIEIRGVVIDIIRHLYTPKKYRTIDLFAGVGGIRLGFEKAGFETVFANDFEENCRATYDLNFKTSKLVVEDIRKIGIDDLPEFDFLLGGFPCQAFSIAGYRKGFEDKEKGNLFFDVAGIIKKRKPMGFLLENVKNLKSHDNGKTFEIIKNTLENLGYHIKAEVLNSMEYGNIPQNRERIYIVGFRNPKYLEKFNFPRKTRRTKKIKDILEKDVPQKYYYNDKPLYKKLVNDITREDRVYQWRRKYVRENKSGVCPTLTANMGTGGHNVPIIKDSKGIRKLTPRECANLQGFPKTYRLPKMADSHLYKQFGNSVTVTVIEAIAKEIEKAIKD